MVGIIIIILSIAIFFLAIAGILQDRRIKKLEKQLKEVNK